MPAKKETKKEAKKETEAAKKETKQEQKAEKAAEKTAAEAPVSSDVLRFVLMTEKAVQLIETQNKLVFIVDKRAKKQEIMKAAERSFGSKISRVTTVIDQRGRKKAYIKFVKEGEAGEIAIRLGII